MLAYLKAEFMGFLAVEHQIRRLIALTNELGLPSYLQAD
jgi:hypothetical protein